MDVQTAAHTRRASYGPGTLPEDRREHHHADEDPHGQSGVPGFEQCEIAVSDTTDSDGARSQKSEDAHHNPGRRAEHELRIGAPSPDAAQEPREGAHSCAACDDRGSYRVLAKCERCAHGSGKAGEQGERSRQCGPRRWAVRRRLVVVEVQADDRRAQTQPQSPTSTPCVVIGKPCANDQRAGQHRPGEQARERSRRRLPSRGSP